ncbi:flagellar biosynthesis protein FlhF [Nitrincola tapanii]|uniref:Flagellar biosynthesis protein FlhF n=1 Tax=Nitrincola tapanii TaxID=1708751 RepID=A0A5A9W7B7_9GAMM|nr:flagellar biosynthesis protein FlhF [Nitrincola tapanii]KAA0876626.1 flagellar biosynthesis protein FlhF [Nitrincola tapanii]
MKVKRIFAPDMRQAMRRVREEIGADAVIISNHRVAGGVELVAAREEDYEMAQAEIRRNRQAQAAKMVRPESKRQMPDADLVAEMQKAQLRIAQARQRAEEPQIPQDIQANRQIEDEDDEDLRFILQSLKARQESRQKPPLPDLSENPWDLVPDGRTEPSVHLPSDDVVRGMQQEIHQLRALLEQQLKQMQMPAASQEIWRDPQHRDLAQQLERLGVSQALSRQLLASLETGLSFEEAWRNLLARLTDSIPVVGEEFIARGGMIAFVGPTGVGKTTTIGKLAARYVLQHGSSGLALVTTDCFRIAAHEQLRTFGRILDVPVRVVDENHNLEEVLLSLRGKRLVLIDTAGMNAQDPMGRVQLDMLSSVSLRLKKLLVLSCSSQRQLLENAWKNYQELGLNACILSKLDESGSLGEAMSLAIEKQLPIAYITDGQKIPDDLVVATRGDLVSRAVVTAERQGASGAPQASVNYRAG